MEERPTIIKCSNLINNTAALTPVTLYQLSTGRTAKIKKIMWYNGQPTNVILEIGTGIAAFTRSLPRILCISGIHDSLESDELPEVEFPADITMQVSAAGAGDLGVEVLVEVEEVLG